MASQTTPRCAHCTQGDPFAPRDGPDTTNWLLQGELGDVVYVELPEVGSTVTKGETFGVVESVKVRDTGLRLV